MDSYTSKKLDSGSIGPPSLSGSLKNSSVFGSNLGVFFFGLPLPLPAEAKVPAFYFGGPVPCFCLMCVHRAG